MTTTKRTCLNCQRVLHGRIDQKFCSDQCRSTHHNAQHRVESTLVRSINRILVKNRRILEDMKKASFTSVSRLYLLEKGFNFRFYTNVVTIGEEMPLIMIYDIGYIEINEGAIKIVTPHDYVTL